MRHLRQIGAFGTLVATLALASEYGCSTSTSLPGPPPTHAGGAATTGGASSASGGVTVANSATAAGGSSTATGGTASATGGATSCTATQTKCHNACFDTSSDHNNCGSCDTICGATEVCLAGTCNCPASNTDPNAGPVSNYQYCGAVCADLQSSSTNCGTCYNVCAPKRCIQGACGCAGTDITCGADGACFDPLTTKQHCGDCATACGQYDNCVGGHCVLSCSSYNNASGIPLTDCGGTCIDTTKNVNNCGGCGTICPNQAAITCINSTCVCGNPIATRCGDLCVDVSNNNSFCGSCDVACTAAHACVGGGCVCASTSIECGGGCYDPASDSNHCGGCDTVCGTGFHCVASACVCNPSLTLCSGICLNAQTDPANCGACGNACGSGQSCTAGKCECDTGMSKCGAICVNEQTDGAHCGDCTTTCSASQTCVAGKCQCTSGQTACGQLCVDAQNDAANCGGCGTLCTPKQMCQGGACRTSVIRVQSSGQADSTQQTQIYVNIAVCNASGASLSLNGISLKYWYTADGASATQNIIADYASGVTPAPTLSATLLDTTAFRVKADSVMSVKFGATTLAAGACTGAMQLRIFAQNYVCCYGPQAGDYSYLAGTTLADNQNITAYNAQGLLIWGLEPALQ